MTLVLDNIGSGYNRSAINNNFSKIEEEINDKVLKRVGPSTGQTLENSMQQPLYMNSNPILNVRNPIYEGEAVNKKYADNLPARQGPPGPVGPAGREGILVKGSIAPADVPPSAAVADGWSMSEAGTVYGMPVDQFDLIYWTGSEWVLYATNVQVDNSGDTLPMEEADPDGASVKEYVDNRSGQHTIGANPPLNPSQNDIWMEV